MSTTDDWAKHCLHWRGRVLTGAEAHWCDDWDGLPVDETCPEWPCACAAAPDTRASGPETATAGHVEGGVA